MGAEICQKQRLCSVCGGFSCLPACIFVNIPDIEPKATMRIYSPNCTVFRQGEQAKSVYVIRSGWIKETHLSPGGKRIRKVMGPGSLLGAEAVITATSHAVSAESIDESELICMSDMHFLQLIKAYPHLAFELLRRTSLKLQSVSSDFFDMAGKKPGSQRLLESLLRRAQYSSRPGENGVKLNMPCSIQDMADEIGCSRQWAFRLFRQLEDQGVASRNGCWITLLAPNSGLDDSGKAGAASRLRMILPARAKGSETQKN